MSILNVIQVFVIIFYLSLYTIHLCRLVTDLRRTLSNQTSVWEFVKTHMFKHYEASITRGGCPSESNASIWEKSHQQTSKKAFQLSNKRLYDVEGFINHYYDRLTLIRAVAQPHHLRGRVYNTARKKVRL